MPDEAQKKTDDPGISEHHAPLSIDQVVTRFVRQINSLRTTLPLLMRSLIDSLQKQIEDVERFRQTHCTRTEHEGILVPTAVHMHYLNLQRRLDRGALALSIVPASFLVSLVSHYDSFLGSLIRSIFYCRPELLQGSERALTFKELNEFANLQDARDFIVEKEVEGLIRKSHQEQFEWLENKFKTDEKDKFTLRKELPSWPTFIEITERRNLFVHCDGVVSSQYLKVCNAIKLDCKDLAPGTQLQIDLDYFLRSWDCVFEIGVKLSQVLWRKIMPLDRQAADENLSTVTYDLIVEERYDLAINLLEFATQVLKKHSSDHERRVFIINKAQAYKWSGESAKARQVLGEEDWSSTADKFNLAVLVIKDDFDSAAALMERIGPDGSPSEHSYQNWPLFKEFRKSDQFKTAYKKVFGRPFTGVEEMLKVPVTTIPAQIESTEAAEQKKDLLQEKSSRTDPTVN